MLLYLWLTFAYSLHLNDGQVFKGILSDIASTSETFEYIHIDSNAAELVILVSCDSDVSDPQLMIGTSAEVSQNNYLKYDSSRNHALLRLKASELELNQKYYIKLQFISHLLNL